VKLKSFVSLLCVVCASVANQSGCQTDKVTTSDGSPPRQKPNAPPITPAGAKVNRMALFVGQKPDDTNGNGYPDLINVTVMLFSSPHPTAILEPGAFTFTLYPQGKMSEPNVRPLSIWKMEGDAVTRAQSMALGGPCYQFRLSMLDPASVPPSNDGSGQMSAATDKIALEEADLVCRFVPADGSPPVNCDGVRTIQIGRRVMGSEAKR
jgi:hypothetical protein